jgi:hypothetical protein
LERPPAMAWKAALFGAKRVTLGETGIRPVALSAPTRELNPAAVAASAYVGGIVRTWSIMWITPPVKFTF